MVSLERCSGEPREDIEPIVETDFQIFVETVSSKTITLQVEASHTIDDVMALVHYATGDPENSFVLNQGLRCPTRKRNCNFATRRYCHGLLLQICSTVYVF